MTCLFFHDLLYIIMYILRLTQVMYIKGSGEKKRKRKDRGATEEKITWGNVWTRLIKFYHGSHVFGDVMHVKKKVFTDNNKKQVYCYHISLLQLQLGRISTRARTSFKLIEIDSFPSPPNIPVIIFKLIYVYHYYYSFFWSSLGYEIKFTLFI